ncbi:hypothetical protein E3N88_41622 [Mikania micrantha]|uniref:Tf2-1-like SH3-like domain-containing protein n=1 Tax=Mikania micrantha TaxID=192012 RepID=A0A5N6LKZ6_9ASTR|nr:hypothetical protein E3N88_41622 [Mikania micrantha]
MAAAQDRQKSHADKRRKPLEFQVGDRVLLKVSSWKGAIQFGKRGKLNPRYIGPFEITKRIGPVAYELNLPNELSSVHTVFHVSNLKKCLSDETLLIPLEEIQIDEQLNFVEEPVEIMDREINKLKLSKIPIVKFKRGQTIVRKRENGDERIKLVKMGLLGSSGTRRGTRRPIRNPLGDTRRTGGEFESRNFSRYMEGIWSPLRGTRRHPDAKSL